MSVNIGEVEHFQSKPVTVSSTSSIETAASLQNDRIHMIGTQNVSSAPSLIRNTPASTRAIQYAAQRISPPTAATSATSMPSSISLVNNPLRSPSTGVVIPSVASPNAVPEFLYQLTKMLTDNNRDIIEWSSGKIEVHNPHKLESHVLNRYFRHSKFASFQRQLNYFGFRKLAGKGKMAPCSYVNEATSNELRSLLHIKRKTGNEPKSKTAEKKRSASAVAKSIVAANKATRPPYQLGESTISQAKTGNTAQHTQQQAIARVAVGKGIRHGFSMPNQTNGVRPVRAPVLASTVPNPVQSSLNDLQNNYQTSLQQDPSPAPAPRSIITTTSSGNLAYVPGSLKRDDSLVDLAMIPMADTVPAPTNQQQANTGGAMPFIDFWDTSIFQDEDPLT